MLKDTTLFLMLIYMLIGGSSGGTAGGMKTTTFLMLILMMKAQVVNNQRVTLFKRTVPENLFYRSFVLAMTYISILTAAIFLLTITENADFIVIVFEAVSAIATVGLSASLTPLLSIAGKIIIIILMFIGRVGPITILLSMIKFKSLHKPNEVIYPKADILIG